MKTSQKQPWMIVFFVIFLSMKKKKEIRRAKLKKMKTTGGCSADCDVIPSLQPVNLPKT